MSINIPPSENSPDLQKANVDVRSNDLSNDNHPSLNVHAQALLTALHKVVVQIAVPDSKDLDEVPASPEATNFLVALQEYISRIIRDRARAVGSDKGPITKTVNFSQTSLPLPIDGQNDSGAGQYVEDLHHQQPATSEEECIDDDNGDQSYNGNSDVEYIMSMVNQPQNDYYAPWNDSVRFSAALADAQAELRAKVFNKMPIRLLCFQKQGSEINITLLDRAGVCSFLEPKLAESLKANWSTAVWHIAQYAILSHTWLGSGEMTYNDWYNKALDASHPGYQKLANFCRVALEDHGISLGWIDTVCIDKTSSSELDESIRSMYKWYENARMCITYLAKTTSLDDVAKDPWFTRGWTLQELFAPRFLKFYNRNWKQLSNAVTDKEDLNILQQIEAATTISYTELCCPSYVPISQKMKWAASRQVTREEDTAYSLIGLFGINMSIAYGEGAKLAFTRLLKEIISNSKSDIVDIFNWAGDYETSSSALIPGSPKAYLQRAPLDDLQITLMEPLMLTHLGLRVPVLILPALKLGSHETIGKFTPKGDYYATISLNPQQQDMPHYDTPFNPLQLPVNDDVDVDSDKTYNILDARAFASYPYDRYAFAVLNYGGTGDDSAVDISIPVNCFAILFKYRNDVFKPLSPLTTTKKVPTKEAITFKLLSRVEQPAYVVKYSIRSSNLESHGMQFLHMYF